MDSSIDSAIELLSNHFNIKESVIENFLKQNTILVVENNNTIMKFIVPFCGVIYDDCCKAIVFNHGLYTQCPNKCEQDVCKSCKALKYGRIEQRLKLKPDELLVLENGKKETHYKNIIKKYNYDINELKLYFKKNNFNYTFDTDSNKTTLEKKGRGRPRKVTIDDNSPLYNVQRSNDDTNDELIREQTNSEDDDEIEVQEIDIEGISYYLTTENVILDKKNHNIVGLYKNGGIEKIKGKNN